MASKIGIINRALRRIGEQPITSITEGSEEANVMAALYDESLEDELRGFPYTFCVTTAELSEVSNETPPDYGYVYQLPADFLGMVSIIYPVSSTTYSNRESNLLYEGGIKGAWEMREGKLYSDLSDITIKYKKLETDTSKWDAHFVDAFSWRLAFEAAMPLTGDEAKATRAQANYVLKIMEARGRAGNEARRANSLGNAYITKRR